MRKTKSGFTIVELTVVIVIIGILAAISIVTYNGVQARSRDSIRHSDVALITQALDRYYLENGRYPASNGGSTTINSGWSTTADASWQYLANQLVPDYISSMPSDPTSTPGASVLSAGTKSYNYAYFTGNYCGTTIYQMYLLVFRTESSPTPDRLSGTCSSSPVGPYAVGVSTNYRVAP